MKNGEAKTMGTTDQQDPFQDQVMNISLGLTDYGRMRYMLRMAKYYKRMNLVLLRKEKDAKSASHYDRQIVKIREDLAKELS